MSDSDILKFNSFNALIAAGVMTKLVVARVQGIRSEGNNNEVMKQLTILHIKSWEEETFEHTYLKLAQHRPDYISTALANSASPSDLHGMLLVAASNKLSWCLKNMSLSFPTFVSIQSWFRTLYQMQHSPFFVDMGEEHSGQLLELAAECNSLSHTIHNDVMSHFPLFCPTLLMIVLAFVVNKEYSKDKIMASMYTEWVMSCGLSFPRFMFPNISEKDGCLLFSCKFTEQEVDDLCSEYSKPIQVHNIFMASMRKVYARCTSTLIIRVNCINEDFQKQNFYYQINILKKCPRYLPVIRNRTKQILSYQRKCVSAGKTYTPSDRFDTLNDNFFMFGDYFQEVFGS